MHKKITTFVLILVSLLLLVSLFRAWRGVSSSGNIVKRTEDKLESVYKENEELKRNLAKVESKQYVEIQARKKLNLGKEGEIAVILPPISPFFTPTPTPIDTSSNWEKWFRVFYE